jgi:osmotically-inducible protein OsmY
MTTSGLTMRDKDVSMDLRTAVAAEGVRESIEGAKRHRFRKTGDRMTIDVADGKVVLSGSVMSWEEHDDAEVAAWFAPGVADVRNDLSVVPE